MHHPAEAHLETIASRLRKHRPRLHLQPLSAEVVPVSTGAPLRASVALVVRPRSTGLELLLIKRASFPSDPWSGHVAFPGGRYAPEDATPRDTAVRETLEEVGLDLTAGRYLGQLDDVSPRAGAPQVVVSAFAFSVDHRAEVRPNHEVALALWAPLRHLRDPGSATEHLHELVDGTALRFPAIRYEQHVIWGLTHRIIAQFIDFAQSGPEQGGSRG